MKRIIFYKIRSTCDNFECACYDNTINKIIIINGHDDDFIEKMNNMFVRKDFMFCGYSNFHHDDTVVSYILKKSNALKMLYKNSNEVINDIYIFSNIVLTKPEEQWKEYKYSNIFNSIDLAVLLMPKKNRISFMQAQYNLMLNTGDICQDVKNICYIYNKYGVDELKIRTLINSEYNVKVTSFDSVSTGISVLRKMYIKESGDSWGSIMNKHSSYDEIIFNELISDKISFNDTCLLKLLNELKSVKLEKNDKFSKKIEYHNSVLSLGLGGIHSIEEPGIINIKKDEYIIYIDFNSMFPSIMAMLNIYPRHLKRCFIDIYVSLYKRRLRSKDIERKILKWILNSAIGMFRKSNNWLSDPKAYYTITINSQLILLMLAEKLFESGNVGKILNWNTDGLYVLAEVDKVNNVIDIIKCFERDFNMDIKVCVYNNMVQYNGNNYIAFYDNRFKATGLFDTERSIDKFLNFPIISDALFEYFVHGVSVNETIKNCKDIFKFCSYCNVEDGWDILYGFEKYDSNILRYYCSINGKALEKYKLDLYTNKISSRLPIIKNPCTKCDINDNFPDNVDYRFYIGRCESIISEIENVQLSLF